MAKQWRRVQLTDWLQQLATMGPKYKWDNSHEDVPCVAVPIWPSSGASSSSSSWGEKETKVQRSSSLSGQIRGQRRNTLVPGTQFHSANLRDGCWLFGRWQVLIGHWEIIEAVVPIVLRCATESYSCVEHVVWCSRELGQISRTNGKDTEGTWTISQGQGS